MKWPEPRNPRQIPKTLTGLLDYAWRTWPERAYLQWRSGEKISACTYRAVAEHVDGLAADLMKRGVKTGDRVALLSENRPAWIVAYFAVLRTGGVVVPIDSLMPPPEIVNVLKMADSRLLMTTRKFRDLILATGEELPEPVTLLVDDAFDFVFAELPKRRDVEFPAANPDDVAVIIFTSGTTGFSKGVMLTHGNLCADVQAIVDAEILTPDDNFHLLLPLHHTYSSTVNMLGSMAVGARATFAMSYKSRDILDDIRIANVTMLVCVPQVLENLMIGIRRAVLDAPWHKRTAFKSLFNLSGALWKTGYPAGRLLFRGLRKKASLQSLKRMISGGAALRPEVNHFFQRLGFNLLQGYGLTETSPVVSVNLPHRNRIGSVGIALPGVEMRIENPGSNGVGEICVRGGMVMKGYFENPQVTAEVLRNGWFHTGDAGYLDKDDYLFVTGRIKNIIVTSGGKNVYPEEIEAILNMCPCVLESLVVGYERSKGAGEELAALIVMDQSYVEAERERGNAVNAEAAIKQAVDDYNKSVPPYRKLRVWQIHPTEFEKTSTRKIRRYLYSGLVRGEGKGA